MLKEALADVLLAAPAPSYDASSFPGRLCWLPWGEAGASSPQRKAKSAGGMRAAGTSPVAPAVPTCCFSGDWNAPPSLPCLWLRARDSSKVIVYFHANAEDIGLIYKMMQLLNKQLQASVLVPEYPGYGLLQRYRPSERGCYEAAKAAIRYLIDEAGVSPANIILLGRSLGSAPALHGACRYDVGGTILLSPFTSIHELAQQYLGSHLSQLTFGDSFLNRNIISEVTCPVLFVHGVADSVVPMLHSARLFHLCRTRKLLITPSNLSHNADAGELLSAVTPPAMRFFGLPRFGGGPPELPSALFIDPELQEPRRKAALTPNWCAIEAACCRYVDTERSYTDKEAPPDSVPPPSTHEPSREKSGGGVDEVLPVPGDVYEVLPSEAVTDKDPFCGKWSRRSQQPSSRSC